MFVIDLIQGLLAGMYAGFIAVFSALGLQQTIDGLKEEIIAAALGVPTIIVSIVLLIPTIVKVAKIIKK